MSTSLTGKTILVTGGTGSFGREFVRTLLAEHDPRALRIFSRDELKQHQMRNAFKDDPRLRFLIGDVRDRDRLHRAMNGVDIVVHAAALKQVPSCEYNPFEAIKTNILGAQNVIEAAIDSRVDKVVALSTDKAVNPVNLYGATKLCAEKLFIQGNSYTGGGPPVMSCVRYGNVVGSRGSVVELFQQQRRDGALTITDERMTRFWITQGQAVRFIIRCIDLMGGGEVFVPKLPTMKITDLAGVIAPEAERRIIGIRAGEKVDEVLLTEEESSHALEFDTFYVIQPEFRFWDLDRTDAPGGRPLPPGFRYTSRDNSWVLTPGELRQMLAELHDEVTV